jgi:thioredoxin 2
MIRKCPSCGRENRIPARHLAHSGRCGACKQPLPPSAEPLDVEPAAFDQIVGESPVPVLVDFWAPWCGPCRAVSPEVAKAARGLSGKAIVLKVNTDEHPELASRFGVQGIPNFAVFVSGKRVAQQAGAVNHQRLLAMVTAASGTL